MRTLYPILVTISVAFLLGGCSSTGQSLQSSTRVASNFIKCQHVVKMTKEKYPAKNPKAIAFFDKDQSPQTAYRVIGVAKISKFNLIGMERKEDTINDMMKDLAASIGGDGIIDVSNNNEDIEGKVIAFQKILI